MSFLKKVNIEGTQHVIDACAALADSLLRAWFQSEKGDAVSTADFVKFATKQTGVDLAPFCAAWADLIAE